MIAVLQLCFFVGISIVLWGWPMTGMIVEMFGFINLFGCVTGGVYRQSPPIAGCRNFFPVALKFAQSLPVVGHLFMMLERIPSIAMVGATTAAAVLLVLIRGVCCR